MHRSLGLITAIVLLLSTLAASAQDARGVLDNVAKALGASTVKSIQYTGTGGAFAVGQSAVPGLAGVQRQEPHAVGQLRHGLAA